MKLILKRLIHKSIAYSFQLPSINQNRFEKVHTIFPQKNKLQFIILKHIVSLVKRLW